MIGDRLRRLSAAGAVGVIVGIVAFVVHITGSSSARRNGVVTECSYFDLVPWLAGVIGLICAAKCVYERKILGRDRALELGAAAISGVLGAVHLVMGVLQATNAIGPCS